MRVSPKLGKAASRLGRGVRDAWLILGVTVVLVVALEAAYRAQGAVRRSLAGGSDAGPAVPPPPSPLDTVEWLEAYTADHLREEALVWEPYVYFRNPTFEGAHMSVDSAGHRVTPQPPLTGSDTLDVFFLGGSTMFGWFQRHEHTIPALAARGLRATLPEGGSLRVTNFGVPGRIFTQEVIALLLELQAGARPDAVVFYDGINDVMATVQNGVAGRPQNESTRVEDFERGRRVAAEAAPGAANTLRVVGRSVWAVAQRLQLVQRLQQATVPAAAPLIDADSAAAGIVSMYVANVELVEALADRYGFTALYVWQPALLSTEKRLTAREQWLRRPADTDPQIERIRDVQRAVPPRLRVALPPLIGDRFIDATHVFDGDSLEVFADLFGHTYERANPAVVETFLPILSAKLEEASDEAGP